MQCLVSAKGGPKFDLTKQAPKERKETTVKNPWGWLWLFIAAVIFLYTFGKVLAVIVFFAAIATIAFVLLRWALTGRRPGTRP